jgi:hypothetical protein
MNYASCCYIKSEEYCDLTHIEGDVVWPVPTGRTRNGSLLLISQKRRSCLASRCTPSKEHH